MVRHMGRAGGLRGVGLRSQGTLQSEAFALRARGNRVFTFLCSLRPSPLPPSPSAVPDEGMGRLLVVGKKGETVTG